VNPRDREYVDVMIGQRRDFTASLGFEVKGADHSLSHIETDAFKVMIETAVKGIQISSSRDDVAPRYHRNEE